MTHARRPASSLLLDEGSGPPVTTLPAFTPDELAKLHELLAIRVAYMMGKKFEEGDWAHVYCLAKGIPERGWSNLNIDVMFGNLGVEHKMLCYRSSRTLAEAFGTPLMHPSATRSIRLDSTEVDPNEAMETVLTQYAELIDARRAAVAEQNDTGLPTDLRIGWLLWQESLREFLYFEEEMVAPNPEAYYAHWRDSGGGVRKASKNLWIYEESTGRKRYSVTTQAGIKIQPYFDVPPPSDPNVYLLTVIGERLLTGEIKVWLTESTARELEFLVGSLAVDPMSDAILAALQGTVEEAGIPTEVDETGVSILLRADAYDALMQALPGAVSDEHCFRLLAGSMRARRSAN
jgi:hypothetical protein